MHLRVRLATHRKFSFASSHFLTCVDLRLRLARGLETTRSLDRLTSSNSCSRTQPSSRSRKRLCTNGFTPMLFIQLRNVFSSRVSSRFGSSSSAGSRAGKLLNKLHTNARFSLAFPLTMSLARTNLRHFIFFAFSRTSSASLVGSDSLMCGWSTFRLAGAI